MAQLEHSPDDKARVTQGIPSLTSERRRDITERQLSRLYQKSLQEQYRNTEQAATAADGGIDDVTDWEQVVGMPLVGARIITRLRRLNSRLWFEASHADPTKTGMYVIHDDGLKEFLCGMETELNPEFSLRILDDEGKPKGIIAGWRRLLMRLIRDRLITESKANAIFGPPSRDSENWARFTN
jgi:hypothetical protein